MHSIESLISSKFHSVYINSIPSRRREKESWDSKFHSVYINSTRSGDNLIASSKFHSVYINRQQLQSLRFLNVTQNSILFTLIEMLSAIAVWILWSQNSILLILIGAHFSETNGSKDPQNSILFILIALRISEGHYHIKLKIPFCLY